MAFAIDDDAMVLWLTDRTPAEVRFVSAFLLSHDGIGNDVGGAAKPYRASGLKTIHAGADAARFFGARTGDPRRPDLYGVVQHGVVYTGGKGKIAEHGGADAQDCNVPLVVSGGVLERPRVSARPVDTRQIAPTILELLDLDSDQLQAVRIEDNEVLPVR